MTKEYLPAHIDPFRLAEHAGSLRGVLFIKDMLRLNESLSDSSGKVVVNLQFDNEGGFTVLKGHFETAVTLTCQRCLEAYVHEIIENFKMGLVTSEKEMADLPESYDPLLIENNELVIQDMIEDELILRLPIVPMHDPKDCKAGSMPRVVIEAKDENPFKVIEILKDKT